MRAGDAFELYPSIGVRHLWVVIAGPAVDGAVMAVKCTSATSCRDHSCVLHRGDHPFIDHETVINYQMAKRVDPALWRTWEALKKVRIAQRVAPAVLERIRRGAIESEYSPAWVVEWLAGEDRSG